MEWKDGNGLIKFALIVSSNKNNKIEQFHSSKVKINQSVFSTLIRKCEKFKELSDDLTYCFNQYLMEDSFCQNVKKVLILFESLNLSPLINVFSRDSHMAQMMHPNVF